MDHLDAFSATLINGILLAIICTIVWGPGVLAIVGIIAAPITLGIILKLTTVSRL